MAVAHEAFARSHAGTGSSSNESSFSFELLATNAAGVLVFVHSYGSTSNLVSAITAEGVSLSPVSGGRAVDTGGETGDCQAWFVGSGIPAGNLTITVNRTNSSVTMTAWAISLTASSDTEAYAAGLVLDQEDGTLAERSVSDGSPGSDSLRYAALNSGLSAPPSVGANTTSLDSEDFGARAIALCRETTAGQGARNIGWSSGSSDDRAAVYVAIYETSGAGAVDLNIADATHGHTADNLGLTQQHQLAVQDASHAHAADNLALTQQNNLSVADATHGHVADNITLSTEIELSIADALHSHSADNITLVQQHVLAVVDATHGHSADNVVLETGTNLAVADATHAHTVDNLALTQQHVLVVADAFHQHTADNIVLVDPLAQEQQQTLGGRGSRGLLDTEAHIRAVDELHEARLKQRQAEQSDQIEAPAEQARQSGRIEQPKPAKVRKRKGSVLPADVIAGGIDPAPVATKRPATVGAASKAEAQVHQVQQVEAAGAVNDDEFAIVLAQFLLAA